MTPRSAQADVRNPVLALPSVQDGASHPLCGLGPIVYRNRIRARIWTTLRGCNLACTP